MATNSLLFLTFLAHATATLSARPAGQPSKVPALLIFGDSTVDTGNNNYIPTLVQSNHPPYGSAFPNCKPTGRFSNGKLVPDFLASQLGIKEFLPPFLDPFLSNDELPTGVSFASAGSGYDDDTAAVSNVIPMSQQPAMFKSYIDRLKLIVGEKKATKIVNEALILISAGTNDFVFSFYDIPTRRMEYNITGYQDFILQKLQGFVKEIYNLGGRTFAIASLPPIGCVPIQMSVDFTHEGRSCVEKENWDAVVYNAKLKSSLPKLQASLPRSKLVYGDIFSPLLDMMRNPQKYGFTETRKGCCSTGTMEMAYACNDWSSTCSDPSKYMFWDSVHPSEAAYRALTEYLYEHYIKHFLIKSLL